MPATPFLQGAAGMIPFCYVNQTAHPELVEGSPGTGCKAIPNRLPGNSEYVAG